MRITKQIVSFVLISTLYTGLILSSQTSPVNALLSYQTNFNTGTWTNFSGGTSTGTTGSPHTINTNGHTFLFSYGTRDGSNVVYAGSLNNNSANSYFRLNDQHINASARIILAPYDPLGSNTHEMVIAMQTSFYFVSLNQLTLEWESIAAQSFESSAIYSIDEGKTWQRIGDSYTLESTTSPKAISHSPSQVYSSIRFGYYFGVNNLGTALFQVKNPVISIIYAQMASEDAANALKNEVVQYTPCATDEDDLNLISSAKRTEFINKYNALSSEAKDIFASLSIGDGFTALDRYLFLINT